MNCDAITAIPCAVQPDTPVPAKRSRSDGGMMQRPERVSRKPYSCDYPLFRFAEGIGTNLYV